MATDIWLSQNEKLSAYIETDAKNLKQNFKSLSKQVDNIFDKDVNWNEVQWVIKEALAILDIVKAKWNTDLYLKFRKNYEELFRLITQSYENDKKISLAERQEIVLELSDVIKLAQSENIIEEKDLQTKVKDWFERSSASDSKEKSLDLRTKPAKDYTSDEALWAISYLNKNYQKFWKVQANSTEDSYLSRTIDEFTNFSIEDVTNQNQADLLSKVAIKKALNNDAYSKTYIQWYDNLQWNKLIEISSFEKEISSNDITKIDPKALESYFKYLQKNWELDNKTLVDKFSDRWLMQLWAIWSKNPNFNESIKFLKDNNMEGFVNTISTFKSVESVIETVKMLLTDKTKKNDEERFKLSETYILIIHKCKNLIIEWTKQEVEKRTKNYLDMVPESEMKEKLKKDIKKDKNELYNYLINWLSQDNIDLKDIILKVHTFHEKYNLWDELRDSLKWYFQTKEKETKEKYEEFEKKKSEIEKKLKESKIALEKAKKAWVKWEQLEKLQNTFDFNFKIFHEIEIATTNAKQEMEDAKMNARTYVTANDYDKEKMIAWEKTIQEVLQQNRKYHKGLASVYREYERNTKRNQTNLEGLKQQQEERNQKDNWESKENNLLNNNLNSTLSQNEAYTNETFRHTSYWYQIKSSRWWYEYHSNNIEWNLAKSNPNYKKKLDNFYWTLHDTWTKEFWKYRDEIFQVLSNLKWWEALRADSDKMNEKDLNNFLSLIVSSIWEQPKNKTLSDIINQVDELNKSWLETKYWFKNKTHHSNIFAKFEELYFVDWRLDSIKLEKALRQPNNTNNNPENKTKKEAVIA